MKSSNARSVGRYQLGTRMVHLFLQPGTGDADFDLPQSRVVVGGSGDWSDKVGRLVHELTEMAAADLWLRYTPSPDFSLDNGSYLIVASHTQFSEVMARVGKCLAACLPDFARAAGGKKESSR